MEERSGAALGQKSQAEGQGHGASQGTRKESVKGHSFPGCALHMWVEPALKGQWVCWSQPLDHLGQPLIINIPVDAFTSYD